MKLVVQRVKNAQVDIDGKTVGKIEKGIFGADMKVSLLNDGPVTIILEK